MADLEPPVAKYKLTLTVYGNSHAEILSELDNQVQGGYLIISEDEQRDQWRVCGDRYMSVMEHTNPDQTPERYEAELDDWFQTRKLMRGHHQ